MRSSLKAVLSVLLLILSLAGVALAQAGRSRQQQSEPQKKVQKPENAPTDESKSAQPGRQEEPEANINPQDVETVKIETNLITVPVIVSDRSDKYVADLKQEEFAVYEDGVKQDISFFETVTTPFHVVLMLDTSASTQEKLGQIQQAAIAFTEQLQKADRVKVISFDDRVRDLCDFTSDRAVLQWAIRDTRPGQGTKLYDAMRAGLNALQRVKGRKAIVIFTDGVDSYSDRETFDRNVRMIEEAGIIIYPIRYDTREEIARIMRQQQQSGQVIDLGTILGGGRPRSTTTPNTTPPTFPGGSQSPFPTGPTGRGRTTTLPGGVVITTDSRNRRDRDDRYPPDNNDPNSRYPGSRNDPTQPSSRNPNDSIEVELDMLFRTADAYLNEIANKSGGQLYRADTLVYLPRAFAQIAAELRTQYALGYYPSKETAHDGKYHKIKVSTTRKSLSVRARPGYRAQGGGK